MAQCVLAEDDEPLVAVEISKGDVGEEVLAERGLRLHREGDGLSAGALELGDYVVGTGEFAGGADYFAGGEFGVAGVGEAKDEVFFFGGFEGFLGLGRSFKGVLDGTADEGFEEDEVFEIFGNGPASGGFAEVPLG